MMMNDFERKEQTLIEEVCLFVSDEKYNVDSEIIGRRWISRTKLRIEWILDYWGRQTGVHPPPDTSLIYKQEPVATYG